MHAHTHTRNMWVDGWMAGWLAGWMDGWMDTVDMIDMDRY